MNGIRSASTGGGPRFHAIRRRLQIVRLVVRLYRLFRRISRLEDEAGKVQALDALYAEAGRSITATANRLCGGIVKIGQFLSLRQELFPESFTSELLKLHDRVAPVPFQTIRKSVESELGGRLESVFEGFDMEPVASASLAQVHRARLKGGEMVAVKVLRPDIEKWIDIDLTTLATVARILSRVPSVRRRIDFVALHRSFSDTLTQELNLLREAEHMRQFADSLDNTGLISVPKVFADYTTSRLLVMTYLSGASIIDSCQLENWHIDRRALRDAILSSYLRQILVSGVVHLDPHPGNLLVLPEGNIALLDFGMMAEYRPIEQQRFRRLMQCVFFRDLDGVAQVLQELGYISDSASFEGFLQTPGGLPDHIDLNGLKRLWKHSSFRLEARYMLLIRCLGILKTVLTLLTPEETDWFGVVSEHAVSIMMEKIG